MEEYSVRLRNKPDGVIGFGMLLNGKKLDIEDLTYEQSRDIRSLLDSVAIKLYHDEFMKKYGECPTCGITSIFAKEEAEANEQKEKSRT